MNYQYFIIITLTILLLAIPTSFAYGNLTNVEDNLHATNEYYFDNNNTDVGDGSFENPYNNLNNSNLLDSSIIHLASGEYCLQSDRSFSDISFYGESSKDTILNANGFKLTNNGKLNFINMTVVNISIQNNGNLNASNTIFKDSQNDFGGVINSPSSRNIYLDTCEFINNSAKYGGAIYIFEGNLEVINTIFQNNNALLFGGTITSIKSNLKLKNITAFNNNASHEGGVIYTLFGNFSIENSTLTNNSAKNGGGLYIDNVTSAIILNNTFEKNTAILLAGAVYSLANSNLTFENNTYINNTALDYNNLLNTTHPSLFIGDNNYTMYMYNSSYTDELPSYYNLADEGYVTSIKTQSTGGNCWSFAALGALESCILKSTNITFDLSEGNMKNLMAYYSDYGWNYMPNTGGLEKMAIGYLSSWLGPVFESDDEYSPSSFLSPVLNSIAHIQNIIYITRENYTDNDGIKKAILEYGGVATAIKWNSASINYNTYSRYYDGNESSDHAVVIVGWDDNFSKDNFAKAPEGDGAWIIKNSHGMSSGNNGYWYVSYYDTRCAQVGRSDVSYTFILNDTMKYDKNYQYDIPGRTDFFLNTSDTIWYKNIFKSTDNEYLAAVSTHFQKITNYTIYIKVNDELKLTQSGIGDIGYYTINLNELIPLNINDTFEVIFKITVDEEAAFPISEFVSLNKLMYNENISFLSCDGEEWIDLFNLTWAYSTHTYKSQVACIKAFTVLNLINTTLKLNDLEITNGFNIKAQVLNQYGYAVNGGKVIFTINNQNYTVDVINGIANLILNINPGNYNVEAIYVADGYISSNDTLMINISKINTTIELNVLNEHNPVNITARVLNQYGYEVAFGNVTFCLDGVNYTVEVIDGVACLNHTFDVFSYHNVSVFYNGLYYYNYSYAECSFDVLLRDTSISLIILNNYNPFLINATVRDQFDNLVECGNVTFNIDNINVIVNVTNGTACLNYTFTQAGVHNIKATFNDVYYYNSSQISDILTVNSTIIAYDSTNVLNSIYTFKVLDNNGNPLNKSNVSVLLNSKSYNLTTDENGVVTINIVLNVGTYAIKITNPINNDVQTKSIKVIARITENKAVTMYYGAGKYYKVRVRGDNANFTGNLKVTFKINKKTLNVTTDKNGYVSLKISQNPGKYTITALYKGYKVSNKIIVKSTIITKNINVKKSKTIKFKAKLLNSNGKILKNKKIKFKFKGKTYKVKTNNKGIATLKITKKYKVGKYTITTNYGKLTIKNTIKIK